MLIAILLMYLAACGVGALLLWASQRCFKGHSLYDGLAGMYLMGLGIIPFLPWLKLYFWVESLLESKEG